jgi:hypothetical protein
MTTMTEQATQVYSVFIRATPQQVWDGITKPEFTTRYFYGSKIDSTFEPGTRYLSLAGDWSKARFSSPTRPGCFGTPGDRSGIRRPRASRTAG